MSDDLERPGTKIFSMGGSSLDVVAKDQAPGFCQHLRIEVSEAARTVQCRDCNIMLDPFAWIWQRAVWGLHASKDKQRLETMSREIALRLGEMKKEETRIKGRLRRAHRKLDAEDLLAFFRSAWAEHITKRYSFGSCVARQFKEWTGQDLEEAMKAPEEPAVSDDPQPRHHATQE